MTPCLRHNRFRKFLGWDGWCEALRWTDSEGNTEKFVHGDGCGWEDSGGPNDCAHIDGYSRIRRRLGSLGLPVRYGAHRNDGRGFWLAVRDGIYDGSRRWCLRLPTERKCQ